MLTCFSLFKQLISLFRFSCPLRACPNMQMGISRAVIFKTRLRIVHALDLVKIPGNSKKAHTYSPFSHLAEQFFANDFHSDSLPEFGVTLLHSQTFTYLTISACRRFTFQDMQHFTWKPSTGTWSWVYCHAKMRRGRHSCSKNYAKQEWKEVLKVDTWDLCDVREEMSRKLLLCSFDALKRMCENKNVKNVFWNFEDLLHPNVARHAVQSASWRFVRSCDWAHCL